MDLDCVAVEHYLYEHIPLTRAMAVTVEAIDDRGVVLSAPLYPNINHRSTVFGGSISAVAILSAWTFVHLQLQRLAIPCQVVIQSNQIEYIKPIQTEFQAHCLPPLQPRWERFVTAVSQRGKGRIVLEVEIYTGAVLAGRFQGEYVALKQLS
jgi:thioesterase domain-containing protein